MRHRQLKRKRDRDGSVMGVVDCDALSESQISATYCIFSVQHKSVLPVLSVSSTEKRFLGRSGERKHQKSFVFFTQGTVVLLFQKSTIILTAQWVYQFTCYFHSCGALQASAFSITIGNKQVLFLGTFLCDFKVTAMFFRSAGREIA